jgi:hypothetical protein
MSFERQNQLVSILDHLEATDALVFQSIQSRDLTKLTAQGMGHSSPAVALVFQGLREALSQRGNDIVSEIRRILDGSYVESVDDLSEELKRLLEVRLEKATRLATAQYETLASIRKSLPALPSMPSETGLFEHVQTLKPPLFAEIEPFCIKLHNSRAPRLFLKAGEVFAGNRAARSIFTAAKKSLDIIDTYFGPEVFDMLEVADRSVAIRLISDKAKPATVQAFSLFKQQYGGVEFRICDPKEIHDRFIIVDSMVALHVGHSIKDLGNSDSLIDAADLETHRKRFEELWLKGQPV